MFLSKFFKRVKQPGKNIKTSHSKGKAPHYCEVENQLAINIGSVLLRINRCTTFPPANELSAIIPRAEIRRRYYDNGKLAAEEEIILNSITLVDSPRHQESGGSDG